MILAHSKDVHLVFFICLAVNRLIKCGKHFVYKKGTLWLHLKHTRLNYLK